MKVRIDPGLCFLVAFSLLAVPLNWLTAWLVAAALHEAGHILAVRLLGGEIRSIRLGLSGALLDGENMGTYKNVVASLAGPAFGALPLLTAQLFPRLAICAAAFTACNLIPVFPLDGGRVLRALGGVSLLIALIGKIVEGMAVGILLLLAVWLHTPLPVLLILPMLREKYLAKRRKKGYNSATIEMR